MDGAVSNQPAREPTSAPVSDDQFPVIGIGASAGGLRAVQEFFSNMPADAGMTFVVILHLSPDHESATATLLQPYTPMPVTQVTAAVHLAPNQVYVIPPGQQLMMNDGTLDLSPFDGPRGQRAPIDLFFRTLAETHGGRSGAVVLSGTGADGAIGLPRIKERGGVTFAQEPREAEYDGMPRSVIATGLVDFVLPVASIAAAIIGYFHNAQAVRLPEPDAPRQESDDNVLRDIFVLLRTRTGHDFSQYKSATVLRRIGRRMQVNSVTDLPAYLRVLRVRPDEVQALLRDLLISVTNFFRDSEAWDALGEALPQLFAGKRADEQVRVWVAGCATGEEAYSVAMLLQEYASALDAPPAVQVFATDIDEDAIATARQGVYPETIAADVSPERLARFFTLDQRHYHVKDTLRDVVLFAAHNLLRDPPFSRLDLITCRNVLIYLNRAMQEQVLQLFHFTLRADGYLLLGASETTDGVASLFTSLDKAQRLYQRQPVQPAASLIVPSMPLVGLSPRLRPERGSADGGARSFSDLSMQLLAQYAPPTAIVNKNYDIVHLARGAGRFLARSDGEPSNNLLKEIHPGLRLDLRTALLVAAQKGTRTEVSRVRLDVDGTPRMVNIVVQPIAEPAWARDYLLVIFNDLADIEELAAQQASNAEPLVLQLEAELQRTRDQLRTSIEQYETAVEEYKAANEELQAINEELRAASEELETSKEELQSINEELITVNQELKHKVDEVSQINNDLQNLMASTAIGTVFVDRNLRIKRYTPSAQAIFNLIPSDVNRPLTHVTHTLAYDEMARDAARVLDKLVPVEREVRSSDGRWYLVQIQPYRTGDNRIDGAVLTFVDISERKRAEMALRESEERLRLLIESAQDYAIIVMTTNGDVSTWNVGAERMFGYAEREIIGKPSDILFTPEDRESSVPKRERQTALAEGRAADERWHIRKDGSRFFVSGVATPLQDGTTRGFVKIARDLTEQKRAEEALRASAERFRALIDHGVDVITISDKVGNITYASPSIEAMSGYTVEEFTRRNPFDSTIHPDDRARCGAALKNLADHPGTSVFLQHRYLHKSGAWRWLEGTFTSLFHDPAVNGLIANYRDVTERKANEAALQRAHDDLEQRVDERTTELTKLTTIRQELLHKLVGAQEEERRRVARELHDQMGQSLSALRVGMASLVSAAPPLAETVAYLQALAAQIDQDVDRLAIELRPSVLDDLGLVAAFQQHIDSWSELHGIAADLQVIGSDEAQVSSEIAITLYRIAQEGLTNVSKHAEAQSVSVVLDLRPEMVVLIIEDNGRGFDAEAARNLSGGQQLGLLGMQERVALVGGTLTIESAPGAGTTLYLRVPLAQASEAHDG